MPVAGAAPGKGVAEMEDGMDNVLDSDAAGGDAEILKAMKVAQCEDYVQSSGSNSRIVDLPRSWVEVVAGIAQGRPSAGPKRFISPSALSFPPLQNVRKDQSMSGRIPDPQVCGPYIRSIALITKYYGLLYVYLFLVSYYREFL